MPAHATDARSVRPDYDHVISVAHSQVAIYGEKEKEREWNRLDLD